MPRGPVGGGGAPAGDWVATSWSDRVAGAVSSLGDGVEFPEAGEQPAGPRTRGHHRVKQEVPGPFSPQSFI